MTINEAMSNCFRLHEKMRDHTTEQIVQGMDPKVCGLLHQQSIARHEEKRARIASRLVVSPKVIALDLSDGLGDRLEHNFMMPLQRLVELREVEHHDAICHGNGPSSMCRSRRPHRGTPENAFFIHRADFASPRNRTEAAEFRLRQVYAERAG